MPKRSVVGMPLEPKRLKGSLLRDGLIRVWEKQSWNYRIEDRFSPAVSAAVLL